MLCKFQLKPVFVWLLFVLVSSQSTRAADEWVLRDGLAIGSVGRAGRTAFHTDPIEKSIVLGQWLPPHEGEEQTLATGTNRVWGVLNSDKDGVFSGAQLRGGYLYCSVVSPDEQVRILQATGHNFVYVNGEPHAGDPYSNGGLELPVKLRPGTNHFLFQVGRGRLSARLVVPEASVSISSRDYTLPDTLRGDDGELWCAVPVINATGQTLTNLTLTSKAVDGPVTESALPPLAPLTVRKMPFRIRPAGTSDSNSVEYALSLRDSAKTLHESRISLRIRNATDHFKTTFRSEIDGSVQYYAVVPPNPPPASNSKMALFLSTHGAGVEGMGQADAYSSKPWGYLVAPTNRRPYGFDWEDWGRMDALEVLNLAQERFRTDPSQTYLTGHSMGGHGAWQLGVTFPDRFAAVAPSAGWISFFSYGGARRRENPSPVEAMLQRATSPSDTLALITNYLQQAIYILHGDQDDNVPVTEARRMKEKLSDLHKDLLYHEQPGAGHWWGNACVDWPPIFEMFARHKIPADAAVTSINFSTANPGISSSNHWLTIEAQERSLARSSVAISFDRGARQFKGATENVAGLAFQTSSLQLSGPVRVELDGDSLEAEPEEGTLRIERQDQHWAVSRKVAPGKNPLRSGPFKDAFRHRMVFVYGTHGDNEENKATYAKARLDAEAWLYRGNGSVDVLADSEFNPAADPDRSVIIYGNSNVNSAWAALLSDSPVHVNREAIRVGEREVRGNDLACLFARPRAGSERAYVGVVAGTGLAGLRLTERVPYFLAGVGYPDLTVVGVETLDKETDGVRVAGFFGNDWSIEKGEFVWADK